MTKTPEGVRFHGLRKFAVLGSLILTACAGGVDSTTDPTQPVAVGGVSVTVNGSTSLQVGDSRQLAADIRDTQSQPLTGRTVEWSSSAPTVALVSGTGLVSAVGVGSATITASVEGKAGNTLITVQPQQVAVGGVSVTVNGSTSLQVGDTRQLAADVRDTQNQPLTGRTVQWSSGAPAVASVSGTGLVSAVGVGSATITASVEGRAGNTLITVQSTVLGIYNLQTVDGRALPATTSNGSVWTAGSGELKADKTWTVSITSHLANGSDDSSSDHGTYSITNSTIVLHSLVDNSNSNGTISSNTITLINANQPTLVFRKT